MSIKTFVLSCVLTIIVVSLTYIVNFVIIVLT